MKHDRIDPSLADLRRYEVIDTDGRVFGPFKTEAKASFFATVRWPQQTRDRDYAGRGWSIVIRGSHARTKNAW
jgi:hypothetical protein